MEHKDFYMCMLHVLRRSQSTCLQYFNIDFVIVFGYLVITKFACIGVPDIIAPIALHVHVGPTLHVFVF